MSLLEIMVVSAAVAGMAAMAGTSVADQVRRTRAVEAAKNTLQPHSIARDRAVAARTCTETVIVPRLGDAFSPPAGFPASAQQAEPRVAVIEWSDCGEGATIVRVDFFNLDGDVTIAPYSSADARVVFSADGGLTNDRPGTVSGVVLPPTCGTNGGETRGDTIDDGRRGSGGSGETCRPPPPLPPPPADVLFTATTFFGESVDYRIYARVGATEQL
jgi:hypothetical protein